MDLCVCGARVTRARWLFLIVPPLLFACAAHELDPRGCVAFGVCGELGRLYEAADAGTKP